MIKKIFLFVLFMFNMHLNCMHTDNSKLEIPNKKICLAQTNETNLLSTTGITNYNIQKIIAQYAKEYILHRKIYSFGGATSITFCPNSENIAIGSCRDGLQIFDIATGKELGDYRDQESINSINYSPINATKNCIAYSAYNTTLRDSQTRKRLHRFENCINSVFLVNGSQLACIESEGRNRCIKIFDLNSFSCIKKFDDNSLSIAISPNDALLASGSRFRALTFDVFGRSNKTCADISIYHLETGELIKKIDQAHKEGITSIAFSSNGKYLASGSNDQTVKVWDLNDYSCIHNFDHKDSVTSIAFSCDGMHLASVSQDNSVNIWNLTNGSCEQLVDKDLKIASCVAYSPNGIFIACGSPEKIFIWLDLEKKLLE